MAQLTELSEVLAVDLTGVTASTRIISGAGWLVGWSAAESTGAAVAYAVLHDGEGDTGTGLAFIRLPSGGSLAVPSVLPGIPFNVGLWVAVSAGSVDLSVTIARP